MFVFPASAIIQLITIMKAKNMVKPMLPGPKVYFLEFAHLLEMTVLMLLSKNINHL